jgi:iron complex outermembrane recepter protein
MARSLIGSRTCARRFRAGALIALLFGSSVVLAAESIGTQHRFEQPSRSVADVLHAIASQTGVSVLFDPSAVNGRMSRPISGQYTAAEAIARVLQGTGLVAEVMDDGSIVVRPVSLSPPGPRGPASSVEGEPVDPLGPVLAQAASASGGDRPVAASDPPGTAQGFDRVVVTGSRLKRIDSEGPAPVNTYTKADIERSGQPTLERFLSSLNEASVSPGEGGYSATSGQGAVQLRGLPLGSTLVLINGRRIQAVGSSSGDFFNLDLIPMAAVERVEVVPVGSSAVYGGDALAGVVNVILKKSMEGVTLDLRLGAGKGLNDGSVSLATGRRGEQGSFLLLGSYGKTTPLTMAERDFFVDGDYRRFGGIDARTTSCTPGTVTSTTGGHLPGLGSSTAGIPRSASGQLTVGDFAATAGQPNLCNELANGHGAALVHGKESFAVHGTGELRLSEAWSLFGELSVNRDRLYAEEQGLRLDGVIVPASSPHNPFGEAVQVTGRLGTENGSEGIKRNTRFARVLSGVRGELGAGWDLEAAVSVIRDDGERRLVNNSVDQGALNAALASGALNPFATGVAASPDVLGSIWSDSIRTSHGRKDQGSLFVRGPVLSLPAGSADAIVGIEAARDHYQTNSPGLFDLENRRTSQAVYGELRVPLVRGRSEGERPWDLAAATVAARRDQYSDFGGANTYQGGLELRPQRSLLLRGSVATSFKPPTLLQTRVDEVSYTTEQFGLVDPTQGGAPIIGVPVLRTTNPDLQPEKGRAYSLGAVWEPESSSGTRLGVTAWRVRITGLISVPWPQVTLDNEALFPGFVTRDASGNVTRVLYSEVNFGRVETSGTDLELTHAFRGTGGRWTLSGSATRTTSYDVALSPGAPAEDRLGVRSFDFWSPRWKGRLSAAFDAGSWGLGLTSRYLGAYRDTAPGNRPMGDYWVHDVAGSLDLRRLGLGFEGVSDARLSFGISNLGDRMPEYADAYPYYDVTQADWRGRYATLRLSVSWK